LAAAGAPAQAMQVVPGGPAWFPPGRSGTIQSGPQNVLGHFGELHPSTLEALDAEGPLVAFEVILEKIPEAKAKATRAKPVLELFPFQPVARDFAFVVDRAVKAADILRATQSVDRKLITNVSVFDVYEGKGIDPGKKSVAIAVTLQPRDKTMTDQEIEAVAAKIVAEVGKRTGGTLRAGKDPLAAADEFQHRVSGALAGFPGPVHGAPQRLVRGLTGEEDAAADRLGHDLARGLRARRGRGPSAEHPRLVVPARGVTALDRILYVGAVETAEPGGGKINHRRLALGRELAAESTTHVDHAYRGAAHVGEDRGSLPAPALLEHQLIGTQPERIAGQLQRHVIVAAEL